jgi:predicted transcriptional regulator
MARVRVENYTNLIRDTRSSAIVNTNTMAFKEYMAKRDDRQKQQDEIRSAVKEINTLKAELLEIKNMIKEVIKK